MRVEHTDHPQFRKCWLTTEFASQEQSAEELCDSMEILLTHENVKQAWDARDRSVLRASEHVFVTGPSA